MRDTLLEPPAPRAAPMRPRRAPAPALGARDALQRRLGNRGVERLLTRPRPLPGGAGPGPAPAVTVARRGGRPAAVPPAVERVAPALAAAYRLARAPAPAPRSRVSLGPGRPVPPAARARVEASYGYDLGAARLHADPRAGRLAALLGAHAVTIGDHVLIGAAARDLDSPAGQLVLAHELAHVVQARVRPQPARHRMSDPTSPAEREALDAALAAYSGHDAELLEGASADPHAVVWWVLGAIGLAAGIGIAVWASQSGHSIEENREAQVRETRGFAGDLLMWVPIAGSVQDIITAESELQLALGVGFLAFDCATLGAAGVVGRALLRVPGATWRVASAAARGVAVRGAATEVVGEAAERTLVVAGEEIVGGGVLLAGEELAGGGILVADWAADRVLLVAGEEVAGEVAEQAGRELVERGAVVAAGEATTEIGGALGRQGAVVLVTEAGHAALYANVAGRVVKVQGGPLMVRFAVEELAAEATEEAVSRVVSGAMQRHLSAYAILHGTPLDLVAIKALPEGLPGVVAAIQRNLYGSPTSCGVLQGAALEASGLTAEAAARLFPPGVSGRYFPITIVDHWLRTGAGQLVEGGTGYLIYASPNAAIPQAIFGLAQIGVIQLPLIGAVRPIVSGLVEEIANAPPTPPRPTAPPPELPDEAPWNLPAWVPANSP